MNYKDKDTVMSIAAAHTIFDTKKDELFAYKLVFIMSID